MTDLQSSLSSIATVAATNQTPASVVSIISPERLHGYITHCHLDHDAALNLYVWNTLAAASFWETLSYLEVALRNTLAMRLVIRHGRKGRPGSWLDDPCNELEQRARDDIAGARDRVRQKGYTPSDGQTISELSFGFWRFLLASRYVNLWAGLAHGFPGLPNRDRSLVEKPVQRLHQFRNRLAHHEPIWNKELADRYRDICDVLGYIDADLHKWVAQSCRITAVLATCPVTRPYR